MTTRTALVTGASSGIGLAVARHLVEAGHRVVALGRSQAVLAELEEIWGTERLFAIAADLTDLEQIRQAFAAIRERWDGVDLLVNSAGLAHNARLMSGDPESWREMLEVNVLALSVATQEAVADMRSRGDQGDVIHLCSMSGHRVTSNTGMYSATKFAVRALTETLRQELREAGSAIRVTAISPGLVETQFAARKYRSTEAAAEVYGRFPVLEADDIASLVMTVIAQPAHVEIHDLLVRPTAQPG